MLSLKFSWTLIVLKNWSILKFKREPPKNKKSVVHRRKKTKKIWVIILKLDASSSENSENYESGEVETVEITLPDGTTKTVTREKKSTKGGSKGKSTSSDDDDDDQ